MMAQRRWDRFHAGIQQALDIRIAEICPVGLTKRFCQRRTVWGGQILYLNGGQRHRIVNSFIAHQVQIRQAYMRCAATTSEYVTGGTDAVLPCVAGTWFIATRSTELSS
jgi:hypothetical protein